MDKTIDDLRRVLATAHQQNWFAVLTHSEARLVLGELERLQTCLVQAEGNVIKLERQLQETQEEARNEAQNANALAREADDLEDRLSRAEAKIEQMRDVLRGIVAEPELSAWTANKFRNAAGQVLEETGEGIHP